MTVSSNEHRSYKGGGMENRATVILVCQLCATESMTWKLYDLSKPGWKAVAGHHGVSVEAHIDFSGDYTA